MCKVSISLVEKYESPPVAKKKIYKFIPCPVYTTSKENLYNSTALLNK